MDVSEASYRIPRLCHQGALLCGYGVQSTHLHVFANLSINLQCLKTGDQYPLVQEELILAILAS